MFQVPVVGVAQSRIQGMRVMNCLKVAFIGLVGLGGIVGAQASDHGAPVIATASTENFDWAGFYVGLVGGYGTGPAYNVAGALLAAGAPMNAVNGLTGGLAVGVNLQVDQFVLGLESDIQRSGMTQTLPVGGFTGTSSLDYYGTVRARFGYAFDKFLPYLTGGLAYGQGSLLGTGPGFVNNSQTHVGFTLGGGVELAVTENFSVKGEYLYTDLGMQTYFAPGAGQAGFRFQTIRFGVNFLF